MAATADDAITDLLEGAGFDRLYGAQIEPELTRLEANRRKALGVFLLIWAVGLVPVALEAFGHLDVRFILPTLILIGIIAYAPLARVRDASKQAVIATLCAPLGVAYAEKTFDPPGLDDFLHLNLLPRPEDKSFEDHFTGARGDFTFALCEATLSQGSGKSRHTVFHGQIFRIGTPRRLLGTTVVLRDSGWLDRFERPTGLKKVGLEDPVFERIFEVFGSDQVEARVILTPTFMQQLVDLETAYAGQHIRCGFVGADLLIAVEGQDRFEIGSMFSTLVSRARVEGIAKDLEAVFRMIDGFRGA
jgi:hypothetical protein